MLFTAICFVVTIAFEANVEAQGGAYATGVLVLITSAAIAVAIALPAVRWRFGLISAIFLYTTVTSTSSKTPGRHRDRRLFILGIVVSSFVSRVMRSTEIRLEGVEYDETAPHLHS